MARRVGIGLLAAAMLAGCSQAPDPASAPPPPASGAAAERPAFPLTGRWVWADAGRFLPARDVGCGPAQSKLAVTPAAVAVEKGAWRHPAFTVAGWHMAGPDALVLQVEDKTGAGRRRLVVTLDLAEPGFVRFAGATDRFGRPLAEAPEADRSGLAGAFTLLRCADDAVDVAAHLRGPVPGERMKVIR